MESHDDQGQRSHLAADVALLDTSIARAAETSGSHGLNGFGSRSNIDVACREFTVRFAYVHTQALVVSKPKINIHTPGVLNLGCS